MHPGLHVLAVLARAAARGGDAVAHGTGLAVERVVEELALGEGGALGELRGEVGLVQRAQHVLEPPVERASVQPVQHERRGRGEHQHAADEGHGRHVHAVHNHDQRGERERHRAHGERGQPVGDVGAKAHVLLAPYSTR